MDDRSREKAGAFAHEVAGKIARISQDWAGGFSNFSHELQKNLRGVQARADELLSNFALQEPGTSSSGHSASLQSQRARRRRNTSGGTGVVRLSGIVSSHQEHTTVTATSITRDVSTTKTAKEEETGRSWLEERVAAQKFEGLELDGESEHGAKPDKVGAVTKEDLGRSTWLFLHTLAAQYPDKPTKQQQRDAKELMHILTRLYPCKICAEHFKDVIKANPPKTGSGTEFSQWMCHIHNVVNRSLKKPQFQCQRVDARWGSMDCEESACDLQGRS